MKRLKRTTEEEEDRVTDRDEGKSGTDSLARQKDKCRAGLLVVALESNISWLLRLLLFLMFGVSKAVDCHNHNRYACTVIHMFNSDTPVCN